MLTQLSIANINNNINSEAHLVLHIVIQQLYNNPGLDLCRSQMTRPESIWQGKTVSDNMDKKPWEELK